MNNNIESLYREDKGVGDLRSEPKFICPLCLATRARGSAILDLRERFGGADEVEVSDSAFGVSGLKAGWYPTLIRAMSWGLKGGN